MPRGRVTRSQANADKCYRIRAWDQNFETNRTRELKLLRWVPVPNKHDGDGYTMLVDHPNGAAHFGIWNALLQVASKCEPRGTLARQDPTGAVVPHTPQSLARLTRLPEGEIAAALERLVSPIGWIELVELDDVAHAPIASVAAPSPEIEPAAEIRLLSATQLLAGYMAELERVDPKLAAKLERRAEKARTPEEFQALTEIAQARVRQPNTPVEVPPQQKARTSPRSAA